MLLLVAIGVLVAVGAAVQSRNGTTDFAPGVSAPAPTMSASPVGTASAAQPDASVDRIRVSPTPTQPIQTDGPIGRCAAAAGIGSETWKTYESPRYGYSICYPADAELVAQTPATVDIRFTESFGTIEDEFDFEIDAYENRDGLSPPEWADTIPPGPLDIQDPHAVTVNGLPGYQVSRWEFDGSTVFVCVGRGPKMFVLSFVDPLSPSLAFPSPLQAQYADVFAQMLGTFTTS